MARTIPNSHPDHDLLALCAKWQANSRAFDKLCNADTPDDQVAAFYKTNITALFNRIARMKARTAEGVAAKAGVFWRDTEVCQDWPEGGTGKMLRSILREVIAQASAASAQSIQEAA